MPKNVNKEIQKFIEAVKQLLGTRLKRIILSPVIKNIENYNSKVNVIPFYKNVQKEGVVLLNR